MNEVSNNPQIVLLRERVDDLGAYLEMWNQRQAMADHIAARAAGNMALERISAIATQLSDLGVRLTAELRAYDDGLKD